MITGVLLLSSGGIPIIIREYEKGFFSKIGVAEVKGDKISVKGSLLSSFLSAISDFSFQLFGTRIKNFCTTSYCVYVSEFEDMITVVFSKVLSPLVSQLIEEFQIKMKGKKIEASLIDFDPEMKNRLIEILDSVFLSRLDILNNSKRVFENLKKVKKININEVSHIIRSHIPRFEKTSLSIFSKKFGVETKIKDMGILIDRIYTGHFWDTIRLGLNLYKKNKDLKNEILSAVIASGIALQTMGLDYRAPLLDELKKLVEEMDDTYLRRLLKHILEMYHVKNSENLSEIIKTINELIVNVKTKKGSDTFSKKIIDFIALHHLLFLMQGEYLPEEKYKSWKYMYVHAELYNFLNKLYAVSVSDREALEESWFSGYINALDNKESKIMSVVELLRMYPLINLYEGRERLDLIERIHKKVLNVLEIIKNKELTLPIHTLSLLLYPVFNYFIFLPDESKRRFRNELVPFREVLESLIKETLAIYFEGLYPRHLLIFIILGLGIAALHLGSDDIVVKVAFYKIIDDLYGPQGLLLLDLNPNIFYDTITNAIFIISNFILEEKDSLVRKTLGNQVSKGIEILKKIIEPLPIAIIGEKVRLIENYINTKMAV